VLITVSAAKDGIHVHIESDMPLTDKEIQEVRTKVNWMLKLDENMDAFYGLCRSKGKPWKVVAAMGRGRLLRSSTLFEDVVKTICTTNITWSQTKSMVQRIVQTLGTPYSKDSAYHAFPTPEQVADAPDAVFEEKIRLGYRNAYVQQLATEIANGDRDLEALANADLVTKELKKELKSIKGVGDYAAHTLLMLLGRYDDLAIDSEFRAFVKKKYFNGQDVPPKEMSAVYGDWGQWQYLGYWFDGVDDIPDVLQWEI